MTANYRLGVDIGGTFTDAMLINEATGEVRICKVPTTPADPSQGFIEATLRILREAGVTPADLRYVVHGTTVATNAIIEGKIARTGFVTTDGFRDMLEIARQIRPSLYDLLFEKPRPLVPRYLCFGVPERSDARGNVLVSLDEAAVHSVAEQLRNEGVEAVAVCFLHSYVNPGHERRTGEMLRAALPGVAVSLSAELVPEFREYFRASTTVVNAAITPVVSRYLEGIEGRLRGGGVSAELLVMQSNGGVYTFAAASEKPVFMVESGPAAGVIAATYLGDALGYRDVISLDMGGTTAKAGLVQNGAPRVTKDYEVGAAARAGTGSSRGRGYPIRTPVIDLVEIGAGGGSIAWVDSGGALRVGPQSAGADPGPACYGKGGSEPTVTDANLVLGRLNPQYFLGGEVQLDVDLARRAIEERCARPLGMGVVEAAFGIIEIANAAMVNALRLVSVQRGYDPRDFALIAFGGAGPVHANRLAEEMQVRVTVVPTSPGITSAMGLLVSDLKHEYSSTLIRQADQASPGDVEAAFRRLEAEGRAALEREGIPPEQMKFHRQTDMRYVGQSFELAVSAPGGRIRREGIHEMVGRFHAEHERAYGFSVPQEPVELVSLRVTAIGDISRPSLRRIGLDGKHAEAARKATRPVYFAEAKGYADCPIYDRYRLGEGATIQGPAVVEEMDSTTIVHPGWRAEVDAFGNLLLSN
jgi:N-methylhydantoinase A